MTYVSFLNPAQYLIHTGTKKMDKIKCTAFKKWCNVSVVTPYLSSRHKQKDFSLLKPSVNRLLAIKAVEELWPGLLWRVLKIPQPTVAQ